MLTCQVTLLSYLLMILCSFLFSTDHKLDESQFSLLCFCSVDSVKILHNTGVTVKLLCAVKVVHLLIPCTDVITASDIKILLSVPDSLSEILCILLIYETKK